MDERLEKQCVGAAAGLLPWLADERVTDILVNGTETTFVERDGSLEEEPNPFSTQAQLFDFIERLLLPLGKRVDAAHPYMDGRLVDGSRFHLILAPIALGGPLISIRKFRDAIGATLESFGPPELMAWLSAQVTGRQNLLIAGGTGAGKTTLLSRLVEQVPASERIALIEESSEIRARHPHLVRLEARPPSPDGRGEVSLRSLIRNTLRMRPDRVVLGECRGEEAFDLVQVMNTGHPGSFCTLHANSARDALRRLESLVLLSGTALPLRSVREWIGATVQVVVHLERAEGKRRIREVLRVQGMEGEVYRVTPCYRSAGVAEIPPQIRSIGESALASARHL